MPMPTLADALRGYQPPTTSALSDPMVEHFRTLPQQLATNQQAMDNTMASMYKTDMGTGQPNPNYRPEAMNEFTQMMPMVGALTAWHGTPHNIAGKFDINKVGTGEGAQHFGHGVYFAEEPNIAETFAKISPSAGNQPSPRRTLNGIELETGTPEYKAAHLIEEMGFSKAKKFATDWAKNPFPDQVGFVEQLNKTLSGIKNKSEVGNIGAGNLYKVDIPDEQIPHMLDWYKPLGEQTPEVQAAIQKLGDKFRPLDELEAKNVTGERLYRRIENSLGKFYGNSANPEASKMLKDAGITGVKYENFQIKKGKGAGTHNYVVFDPSEVKILEKNGVPTRKDLIQQQVDKLE
jgi:hypothetical protein